MTMLKKIILITLILFPILGITKQKPNILFILTDQHKADVVGCYGNKIVKTPHMDKLAENGIKFNYMYVNVPQTWPSHGIFYTGRYSHANGIIKNTDVFNKDEVSLAQLLKKDGYDTAAFGKVSIRPNKNYYGFDTVFDHGNYMAYLNKNKIPGTLKHDPYGRLWMGIAPTPEKDWFADKITTECIDYLKKQKQSKKPFYIWLSFWGPHAPYTPPQSAYIYKPEDMPVPKTFTLDPKDPHPPVPKRAKRFFKSEDEIKQLTAYYYSLVTLIDKNIGRAIRTLKELGQLDNTIIVYTSDHGDQLGDFGLFSKGTYCYEGNTRIPFIVSYPGLKRKNIVIDELGSQVDIMPTLLDMSGSEIPKRVQGKSFRKLLEGKEKKGRDEVFSIAGAGIANGPAIMVRNKDWKLVVHWFGPEKGKKGDKSVFQKKKYELYDMNNDRLEKHNLAAKAEYSDLIQKLELKIKKWRTSTEGDYPPSFKIKK